MSLHCQVRRMWHKGRAVLWHTHSDEELDKVTFHQQNSGELEAKLLLIKHVHITLWRNKVDWTKQLCHINMKTCDQLTFSCCFLNRYALNFRRNKLLLPMRTGSCGYAQYICHVRCENAELLFPGPFNPVGLRPKREYYWSHYWETHYWSKDKQETSLFLIFSNNGHDYFLHILKHSHFAHN